MNFLKITQLSLILGAMTLLFCQSCTPDEMEPEYTVPTTYNFENVSYSGQTQRLAQFTELKNYMATSQAGEALDADRLQAMYANSEGAEFEGTYDASKQLRGKTLEAVQADFDALLNALAEASQSTEAGTAGVSGVIVSANGEDNYLVGADGLDHAQIIEKGLMGACLYYQAVSVYMADGKMNVDNETVMEGEGTEMEHHWDEAFGYFGVSKNFPTDTDGLVFWGNYSDKRNALLGSNKAVMDALLKGRAAISNDDLETRDEAIAEARAAWELISVGSALHYINDGIANFDDMALRSHSLSEAIGFIYSLQFNDAQKITNSKVNSILTMVAGSSDFADMNLYNTTVENLNAAKDELAAAYGLEAQKDEF